MTKKVDEAEERGKITLRTSLSLVNGFLSHVDHCAEQTAEWLKKACVIHEEELPQVVAVDKPAYCSKELLSIDPAWADQRYDTRAYTPELVAWVAPVDADERFAQFIHIPLAD